MSVTGVGTSSSAMIQSLTTMRSQLDDLQEQLGTGKKADTYAGMGSDRGLGVGLRSQLTALDSYQSTTTTVSTRLQVAQTLLGNIDTAAQSVKNAAQISQFAIDSSGQTSDQRTAANQLDAILSSFNEPVGDHYLFSGSSADQPAVENADVILNGSVGRAGLKQIISERQQADVGASGLGRLSIPAATGTTVSVAEDVAGSPFGFKLDSVSSTLTGATVTGPTGTPPGITVDLGATNPSNGDALQLTLKMPDGTTTTLSLTATTQSPPGAGQFTIGATSADTAVNLQAALTTSVKQAAGSTLTAASAMQASNEFFDADVNNPPLRVDGPPFDSATSLTAGTAANSVIWYTGDAGASSARSSTTARVDTSLTVSYGMRANEQGLRNAVQNVAVFAATSYSATDTNAQGSYDALRTRVAGNLAGSNGQQSVTDIESDMASAQQAVKGASDRQTQTQTVLTSLLDNIEGVSQDEVASKILALQTSLQASLQATASLYKISLVNYL